MLSMRGPLQGCEKGLGGTEILDRVTGPSCLFGTGLLPGYGTSHVETRKVLANEGKSVMDAQIPLARR